MNRNNLSDQNTRLRPEDAGGARNAPIKPKWIFFGLILMIVLVITVLLGQEAPEENQSADFNGSLRSIGPETAPVTITEYADFGCISCQAWHQFGIREQVLDAYGGQVQFVWRDFPVTTPHSPKAAEAGFCAYDQDRFWDYHNILFENAPALAVADLKAYAESLGLDMQQFNQCLDSGKHQQAVEKELADAQELGLRGVPSFTVNGTRLIGPPSFEQLAAAIDEILASQD